MDIEFADDLLCGFSGPSDVESSQSSNGGDIEEEKSSLDLLSAMLEGTPNKKDVRKKQKSSQISKRNKRTVPNTKNSKVKGGVFDSPEDETECEVDKTEEMSDMKARMKEMEAELQRLRQHIGNKEEETKKQASTSHIKRTRSKTISTGEKKRTAHYPSTPNGSVTRTRVSDSSINNSDQLGAHSPGESKILNRDVSSGIISQRRGDDKDGVLTEKYSGLRVKNPLVSSEQMSQRMSGRKMIRIPRISSRVRGDDIEGDWVTIGVVVDKLPPRDTKKGDKFAIWKLSDLSGQTSLVSLFLFGKAYQEHWKTPVGHVVALLNPSIMPSREGGSGKSDHSTVALSLDHPKKLMLMGVSQDFTICRAQTKSGRKCTNFAKSSDGGYCDYHTQSAYSRSRSHRMEFQNGYGPSSSKLQEKLFKNSKTDFYFCQGQTFVASGKGSSTKAADSNYRGISNGASDRLFVPGAKESATKTLQELRQQRDSKGGVVGMPSGRGVVTQEGSEIFKQMLQKQSAGARMLTKHLEREAVIKKEAEGIKPVEKSAKQLLKEHTDKTEHAHQAPLSSPVLGRGFAPGGMLDLGSPAGYKKPSLAKMKAISLVKRNARAASTSSDSQSTKMTRILERVQESRDTETIEGSKQESDCEPHPSKRRKLDPKDMERILNAKSSHDWIVKETELEMEEEYFERLEKKENMEEKLQSIKELRVSVVQCRECNYTAEYPGDLCRKEKHHLSKFKATKKCFQCKSCSERCFVYNGRPPVDSCKKCGGTNYQQCSLYRERKGPKLPTEQLKLRGDEEKFLNSLH